MTLRYRGRNIYFECDAEKCYETTTEWPRDEFDDLKTEAETDGWEFFKTRQGDWQHFCGTCSADT